MRRRDLVARSLRHYWRTNLAVACGVGVAVSALAGALVVGASVRTSLRDLALSRLGRTDVVITATTLFTEQLGERLERAPSFQAAWRGPAPLLALEGVVTHERSGARAGGVQVFGVDDRFWQFHAVDGVSGPAERAAYLSPSLARELGTSEGDALLLRVQKPSTIPAGLIQGRRSEPGRGIRLTAARVLPSSQLGDFSPRPQQGASRTIFVPLDRLQRDLDLLHRANMLLAARAPGASGDTRALDTAIQQQADLADLGIRLRPLSSGTLAVESDTGLLSETIEAAASAAALEIGVEPVPVLTYLATAIKANGRETPYSLVTAMPMGRLKPAPTKAEPSPTTSQPTGAAPVVVGAGFSRPIWLTQWTADDLAAEAGDTVTLEYYLWSDADGLTTSSAQFTVAGVMPMTGLAVDADLTPEYPGMSTSANMTDWDPPFPVDLEKIRPKDEDYWDEYLTAPKAFITIEDGRSLWQSRYGKVSSLRLTAATPSTQLHAAYRDALPRHLTAAAAEFRVIPLRDQALAAASGTTDFGAYFTYFSFFLVVSSLLLTLLFFRLGIEQRAREVGLLAAIGYSPRAVRTLLLAEGGVLALAGAALGVAGALAYSWLIMLALRTWWVDAVGTTDLHLHASPEALLGGAATGVLAGLACIAWSLRVLRRSSARQLMSGSWVESDPAAHLAESGARTITKTDALHGLRGAALAAGTGAGLLVLAGWLEWIPPAGAFFGSGTLLLAAGLCALAAWLRGTSRRGFIAGRWPIGRLGLRNARYRPSRSVLAVALIAAATFLIVAVGAFRRGAEDIGDRRSSSGGYALIGETLAPLMHDPSTDAGRDALNLNADVEGASIHRFRLRPGDDASCLNLYRPQSPRLLGATDAFIAENRFSFARTIATEVASPDTAGAEGAQEEERDNPWLLLHRRFDDGAIPVIGDSTSLSYVFHLAVGDDFVMQGPDGEPLRLRIVASLRDSVLQSELIMSEAQFTRLFPRNEGYRVFLMETDPTRAPAVSTAFEDQLQDFGMDVQSTAERLASYHRVENTFLTTFQALGALGLVLGTLGLGTVLLRNVLERRRELALLQATGYRRRHLVQMVLAESSFLLASGLALGVVAAAVAVAPAYLARAQAFPILPTLGLLAAVLGAGLLSTIIATRVVAKSPLLEALKNE
jgi:ABC-type lipoprotein release transport system permease subunit